MKKLKQGDVNPIFILLNDIHIDKSNGELVKDIFKQVVDIAVQKDIMHIVIGGDVFTNRSGQPLDCLTTFQEILDMAEKADIIIDAIPGNHDKTDPNDYRSYIDVYKGNHIFTIHREGCSAIIGGCAVAFVPYFDDESWKREFDKAAAITEEQLIDGDVADDAPRFLITHVAIDGVRNNDGSEVLNDLKPGMFDLYTKVFVGHYHNASKIGKNVYYTGSAYQGNFGENLIDKGCTIVYDDGHTEFVALKFPKHIKHEIDVNDSETLRNLLEKYEGEKYDIIRFVFKGKKVDASKVDLSYIESKGIQCEFESIEEKEAIDNSTDEDALNYDKRSVTKDFLKFCKENGIKGEHLKFGLNLIKQYI